MRGNAHVRCGGRGRANHRAQARHGGSPPTLHLHRPRDQPQRQELELRGDVPALDRRRDARSRDPIPERSRATAASPTSRSRSKTRPHPPSQTQPPGGDSPRHSLHYNYPPGPDRHPKFHDEQDILGCSDDRRLSAAASARSHRSAGRDRRSAQRSPGRDQATARGNPGPRVAGGRRLRTGPPSGPDGRTRLATHALGS